MTETLWRMKREKDCDCDLGDFPDEGGVQFFRIGVRGLLPCPHGSTVERIPTRIVDCNACGPCKRFPNAKVGKCRAFPVLQCFACLGTGLRLEPEETP